jgi:superfamily II DNA or RNA helicase
MYYPRSRSDGLVHLFEPRARTFPAGLLQSLQMRALGAGVRIEVEDARSLPDDIDFKPLKLHGINPWQYPYDYQADVIFKAIEQVRGVLELGTNSGKTEIIAGIVQIIDQPALILTHTKILLDQT